MFRCAVSMGARLTRLVALIATINRGCLRQAARVVEAASSALGLGYSRAFAP